MSVGDVVWAGGVGRGECFDGITDLSRGKFWRCVGVWWDVVENSAGSPVYEVVGSRDVLAKCVLRMFACCWGEGELLFGVVIDSCVSGASVYLLLS